jgi:subfamily B ATP-binding cassette protein MsbA
VKSVLKKLYPYLWVHRWPFLVVFGCGLLLSATDGTLPYLSQKLFDDVFVKRDQRMALLIPAAIPLVFLIHGAARYVHMYFLKVIGEKVVTRLQKELQTKYMHLSLTYYGANTTGALISKTINDIQLVKDGISTITEVLHMPLTIIGLLGWLFYLDFKMTASLFILGPVIVLIVSKFAKGVRRHSHSQLESMEEFTSTLKETVDGIRIIQSFNLVSYMEERLQKIIDHYISFRKKIISLQESSGPITEFLASIMVAGIFYYKGQQIINNSSSVGSLMGYVAALFVLTPAIKKLQEGFMRIQPTVAACERIFEILESTNVVPETSSPQSFPTNWTEIEFRNVSFKYDSNLVLRNVNLKIKRGEVIALVGESGSGKSTLVNLLGRFYDPTSGEILIGGIPIRNFRLKDLRENIALVTQDVFLFNESIETNIRSGNFESGVRSVEDSAKMANAHDFIKRFPEGYTLLAGDRGGRLSGGEKQRVSIARAIYKNAPILILDEATSALDSASEVEVQKGLDKLMEGRTAFVIAHRLSTVSGSNRILVFKSGEIIEQGTHLELMNQQGTYFGFHQLQKI